MKTNSEEEISFHPIPSVGRFAFAMKSPRAIADSEGRSDRVVLYHPSFTILFGKDLIQLLSVYRILSPPLQPPTNTNFGTKFNLSGDNIMTLHFHFIIR